MKTLKSYRWSRVASFFFFGMLFAAAHSVCAAQLEPVATEAQSLFGGVDVRADKLEYKVDRKLLIANGNVTITFGEDLLTADCVTYQTDSQEAYATGNVEFDRGGRIWRGDELSYNFKTGEGDFGEFSLQSDSYIVRAEDSQRISSREYLLKNAIITTCEGENPDAYMKAKTMRVVDGTKMYARHVTFFIGPVPIFYTPYAKYDESRKTNLDVEPGYSSKLGAYLLMAYNYRVNPGVEAATHLDYYSDRGFGIGQDFRWQDKSMKGNVKTYFIDDEEPIRMDRPEEVEDRTDLVDSSRYRIRLQHDQDFSPRDYLLSDFAYQSDPFIREDFFREEYKDESEPENRAVLTHRGDDFTATLTVNKRLNDFYENVDRLPELGLDMQRQQIGSSRFYYDSESSAAYLERLYTEASGDESYDVFRVDSGHTLFYPTRQGGFLNVIPRAGYRGTYYSKTKEEFEEERTVTLVETNVEAGVTNVMTSITNIMETITREAGGKLRNRFELGVEVSFKAFKEFRAPSSAGEGGLRHVIEPYADYTYVPELDLQPDEIYQFDRVDRIGEQHDVMFGLRNKIQTKRRRKIVDLVDLDVSTSYLIDQDDPDGEDFTPLDFDCELNPSTWLDIEFDGEYDWDVSEVTEFNSEIELSSRDESSLSLEYRYRKDRRDQIASNLRLFPESKWSLGTYARYDLEDKKLEEQAYYVTRRTDCLGVSLGYSGRGDDWDVWLQLWLIALPDARLGFEGH